MQRSPNISTALVCGVAMFAVAIELFDVLGGNGGWRDSDHVGSWFFPNQRLIRGPRRVLLGSYDSRAAAEVALPPAKKILNQGGYVRRLAAWCPEPRARGPGYEICAP